MDNILIPIFSWVIFIIASIAIAFMFKKLNVYYYEGIVMAGTTFDDCKAVRTLTQKEMMMLSNEELDTVSIHYHSLMLTKKMLLSKAFYFKSLSPKQRQFCHREVINAERAWARCQRMKINRKEGLYDLPDNSKGGINSHEEA